MPPVTLPEQPTLAGKFDDERDLMLGCAPRALYQRPFPGFMASGSSAIL